jgi:hypothetical protein
MNPSTDPAAPIVVAVDDGDDDVAVTDDAIIALHAAHHARLEELLLQTLEALAAGVVAEARACFGSVVLELLQGLQLEDDVILPLYDTLGPHAPQGRRVVVDGDHTILRRTIEAVAAFLDDVDAAPAPLRQRAIMVGLPVVYRLLHTLEHHSEREARHVYPVVVPRLEGPGRLRVVTELRALTGPPTDTAPG